MKRFSGRAAGLVLTVAVAAALMPLACRNPASGAGTAFFVTVTYDSSVTTLPLQLRLSASDANDAGFQDELTPSTESSTGLPSGSTVLVLLNPALAGDTLVVQVDGLVHGQPVASGHGSGLVQGGLTVNVDVILSTTTSGLCEDAGACPAHEQCVGGACHCGVGASCAPGTACSVFGVCTCSIDAGCEGCCISSASGDVCDAGTSLNACGTGGALCQNCGAGTCVGQQCTSCNAQVCPGGCCANGLCQDAGFASCGAMGSVCQACDPATANACDGGACQCGANPACSLGSVCTDAGTCVCGPESCSGCCVGSQCVGMPSANYCGIDGGACAPCGITSDGCVDGRCACGDAGPCDPSIGQQCVNGTCQCTPTSCPNGCCLGVGCFRSQFAQCGVAGAQCSSCSAGTADSCDGGQCSCGTGPACTGGQHCNTAHCF